MKIILKLKFAFSIMLLCCLFLPLSQCTKVQKPETEKLEKAVIEKQYIFESVEKAESWFSAITLVAPFIILLLTYKTRHKIKSSLAIVALCLAALYSILNATIFAEKLLIGGYLAYFSSGALIVLIFIEMALNYRLGRIAKNA